MRQSHADIHDHPDESEIRDHREEQRRKAQREMLEPPFVYHEVVFEDGNQILAGTWDIRELDDPHMIANIVSELPFVPDEEFSMDDMDEVDDDYTNRSDLDMSTDILVEFATLGGSYE